MFGLWKSKKPIVDTYEHGVFEECEFSTSEFYASIEKELEARQMPGLTIERIEHNEGGLLSAKRQYLRLRRERLVFDVCLAPFGTYWFYSHRYSLIPFTLRLWELLLILLLFAGVEGFYVSLFGLMFGSLLFGSSLLAMGLLMRNLLVMGLNDLDAALLQIPVLGAIYEVFFRKETYQRVDTRNAYISIINSILQEKLKQLREEKNAKLVDYTVATLPSHPSILNMIGNLLRMGR